MAAASNLLGSEQLIMVMSDELNATTALLQRYEKKFQWEKYGKPIAVTLGRSGLGWEEKEPKKMEGDGRSPAGVFSIDALFGYSDQSASTMPYWHADESLICIDDVSHPRYNQITRHNTSALPQSYEQMRRQDDLYRLGAVIGYNRRGEKGRGSCIFLHLNHPDKRATAGCTAMDSEELSEVLNWLKLEKTPQILQIPQSECGAYQKAFPGIECE